MAPILVFGLSEGTDVVNKLSAAAEALGQDKRLYVGLESATINPKGPSITSAHLSKSLIQDASDAETLPVPVSPIQRKRGTTAKFEKKNPYIPPLNPQVNGLKSSEEQCVIGDDSSSSADGSGSSSDWDSQRKVDKGIVKRLGTNRRQVRRAVGMGNLFGAASSCVGIIESVSSAEGDDNDGKLGLDKEQVIRPLSIRINRKYSETGTTGSDHDSSPPQSCVIEPTTWANRFSAEQKTSILTHTDSSHTPPTQLQDSNITSRPIARAPTLEIKNSKRNIPSEPSSRSIPLIPNPKFVEPYQAPTAPSSERIPLSRASTTVQEAMLEGLETALYNLGNEQLGAISRIPSSHTQSSISKKVHCQSTEKGSDGAVSGASCPEAGAFDLKYHNHLRERICSVQQGTEVALSSDSSSETVCIALKDHNNCWERYRSPQQQAKSCTTCEGSNIVVNGYGAKIVSPMSPPFDDPFTPYPQNSGLQHRRLMDGSQVVGDVKSRDTPTSLNSGEHLSPIQPLSDINNNTLTPQRKTPHMLSKHSQCSIVTHKSSRPHMEQHEVVQSQPILTTILCHRQILSHSHNRSQTPLSTRSKVSSLPPYSSNDYVSEEILSSKDRVGQPCLVVPRTSEGGSENRVKLQDFAQFDLPPRQQQTPSVRRESKAATATGSSKISRHRSHSSFALALAHNEMQSSKPAESTLAFLRHHDHPKLRNTPKQRDITSRARYEAKIFTEASKARELILVARQKLENERHQASINTLFSELDEHDSFTMRYPMFKSPLLYFGLMFAIIGIIGLSATTERALTFHRQGVEILDSLLVMAIILFAAALVCGLFLVGMAMYQHGAFAFLREGDLLGLREVTARNRRGARGAYADLEAGIIRSSNNRNVDPTIARPAPSRTRQFFRGVSHADRFSPPGSTSGMGRAHERGGIEMDNLDRHGRAHER